MELSTWVRRLLRVVPNLSCLELRRVRFSFYLEDLRGFFLLFFLRLKGCEKGSEL